MCATTAKLSFPSRVCAPLNHSLMWSELERLETLLQRQFWRVVSPHPSWKASRSSSLCVPLISYKLLLMACPRLRWALRQILGVARLLEDAVQEVEAEHPNLVKQPDPQFSAVDEPQALVETSEHEKQPEFTSTPCNAARHRV